MSKHLDKVVKLLQRKFGETAAQRLGSGRQASGQVKEVIPTGIEVVDHYLLGIGGLPVGRISEVCGEYGCLAADTRIGYQVRRSDGTLANSKGGTIEQLFRRVRGARHHSALREAEFYAPSMKPDHTIVQNRVVDVLEKGVRECFTLVTRGGERITATADHEFYVGDGEYAALESLKVGSRVYVHDLTRARRDAPKERVSRVYIFVKHHPVAGTKVIGGRYSYKRLARARAVVEADINGLALHEYVRRLNCGDLDGLNFLSRMMNVHHKDEDVRNDALENLEVVEASKHTSEHTRSDPRLLFVVQEDFVDEIVPAGPMMTYDVVMADPHRNFVANRVVVHNCGKTAFAYQCAAAVQRVGGSVYFFDNERTFDEERATTYGCDIDSMVLPECVTMEMGIEQTKLILENHDVESGPMLIVWDTVAAMLPKADRGREAGERGTAEQARLLSTELPKIVPLLSARRAHLLLLNQIRKKIGVFFGPDTVTPGGNSVAFYTSWRAQFFGGKAIKKGDEHTGKMVTLLTTKTKFTAPHRKARLRLDYASGWHNEWSTLEHAKTVGVAQRTAKGEAAHLLALNKLGWLRGASNEERGDGDSEEAKFEEEE